MICIPSPETASSRKSQTSFSMGVWTVKGRVAGDTFHFLRGCRSLLLPPLCYNPENPSINTLTGGPLTPPLGCAAHPYTSVYPWKISP